MPLVLNACSKPVALVAGGSSFNALLGENGIGASHLCQWTIPQPWQTARHGRGMLALLLKAVFPPFPSQLKSSMLAPRSLSKPVRQSSRYWSIPKPLLWFFYHTTKDVLVQYLFPGSNWRSQTYDDKYKSIFVIHRGLYWKHKNEL